MAHVYHWKHGWIPLDHTAALSKAKGDHAKAAQMLSDAPSAGIHTRQDLAKAVRGLPDVPAADRAGARHQLTQAADTLSAHDLLPAPLRPASGWTRGDAGLHEKVTGTHLAHVYDTSRHSGTVRYTVTEKATGNRVTVGTASSVAAARAEADKALAIWAPDELTPPRTRSSELAAAAQAKRDEAARIGDSAGVGDRAAGRLNPTALKQAHRSTDSQLRRFVEADQAAKALDFKAGLARSREAEAARVRLTHADVVGARIVQDKWGWHEVVKVNQKTVTVKTAFGNETIAIEKIRRVGR